MQVVSEGCREAYVQRRTVRVCTGGRGRLGLDDLLLLRGLGGGLALLPLPEAVLVHEPERDDEEPGADDRADRHGDEIKPKCVAPVTMNVRPKGMPRSWVFLLMYICVHLANAATSVRGGTGVSGPGPRGVDR